MAFIKNLDPNGPRTLIDIGITVESGDYEEVPDEVAASLAEQSVWEEVDARGKAVKIESSDVAPSEDESQGSIVDAADPVPDGDPGPEVVAAKAPKKSKSKTKAGEAN